MPIMTLASVGRSNGMLTTRMEPYVYTTSSGGWRHDS